ncbi:MAG TPA: DUF2892 domain-containing protein [Methanosarcinaceae archaeon]|nr:DUF2892 domain-containing protein [Methanosarcinaceae archaeon]
METNEGTVDRVVRIVLGLVLIYVGVAQIVTAGILTYIIAVVGLIILVTGVTGHCQLYTFAGINTCTIKDK